MVSRTVVGFVLGAVLAYGLVLGVLRLSLRFSLVNRNESRDQVDYRRVSRLGGIGIAIAFALTHLVLTRVLGIATATTLSSGWVWLAALLVVGLGLVDDFHAIGAQYKLLALLAGGALVSLSGHGIEQIPIVHLPLGSGAAITLTALWFALVGTAWNFIDGLDGLAAGLAIISALVFWFIGPPEEHASTAMLAGVAFGFLALNRHPSRIFMGDSGSFFFGFFIALIAIRSGRQGHVTSASGAALLAIAWPLADFAWALVRRTQRSALFTASGDHLHYLLNRRIGHRGAVQVALCAGGAVATLSVAIGATAMAALAVAVCIAALWLFCARVRIVSPAMVTAVFCTIWIARIAFGEPQRETPLDEVAPRAVAAAAAHSVAAVGQGHAGRP